MKKTLAIAFTLGLAACGEDTRISAVAPTPVRAAVAAPIEPVKLDDNQVLAGRVIRAMEDGKLFGIDVVAETGIVTLWGSTASARERSRAAEIAKNVEGVRSVENRLVVVTGS